MPDSKISDFTALGAAPASGDLFVVVDVSPTPDETKKVTFTNLKSGINSGTFSFDQGTESAPTARWSGTDADPSGFYEIADNHMGWSINQSCKLNLDATGLSIGDGENASDRTLHPTISDAATNAVSYAQRISHITSGTAVAGFGTGIEFELEENDGTNRVAGYITCDWEDAGEGTSADGRLNFGVMTGDAAAATAMSIWNGYVGIGETAPDEPLHIKHTGDYGVQIETTGANKNPGILYENTDGIVWYNGVNIDESGNNDFQFRYTGSTYVMTLGSDGNVGIGDQSPTYKLDVAGKIGINNTQICYLPDQTNFTGSLVYGTGGTNLAHAAGSEGFYNTLLGMSSGDALTSGENNVAIGYQSMFFSQTGDKNVIIGSGAGYGLSANSYNSNVFIGYFSGRVCRTGSSNIAIGDTTGAGLIGGSSNIFIGHVAAQSVNSGTDNICIGRTAGNALTSGTNSLFIGRNAGLLATGSGNLCLGYHTGDNITSGTNNIVIGYDLDVDTATDSNKMYLGHTGITNSRIAGIVDYKTEAGITASTTQSQGQQPLVSVINEVATVANANDVVTLPSAITGMKVHVINKGANTLQIFPASGDDINDNGVDTSITLASGNSLIFLAINTTDWVFG